MLSEGEKKDKIDTLVSEWMYANSNDSDKLENEIANLCDLKVAPLPTNILLSGYIFGNCKVKPKLKIDELYNRVYPKSLIDKIEDFYLRIWFK